jgi:urease accessory protein
MSPPSPESIPPLALLRRHRAGTDSVPGAAGEVLRLPLTAEQRTRLRGHRRSSCGRDLLLQLPRGEALEPGEWLEAGEGQPWVRVEAAPERLLVVRSQDPLGLLQAAYHLGNRHVALEVHAGELRLLEDSVLADLLRQRGLDVTTAEAPFRPEAGAYATTTHGHGHHHDHGHGHP